MEHHSNIVPWQLLFRAWRRAALPRSRRRWAPIGRASRRRARPRRRALGAFAHVSNVLGTINPVAEWSQVQPLRRVHGILCRGRREAFHLARHASGAVDARTVGPLVAMRAESPGRCSGVTPASMPRLLAQTRRLDHHLCERFWAVFARWWRSRTFDRFPPSAARTRDIICPRRLDHEAGAFRRDRRRASRLSRRRSSGGAPSCQLPRPGQSSRIGGIRQPILRLRDGAVALICSAGAGDSSESSLRPSDARELSGAVVTIAQ